MFKSPHRGISAFSLAEMIIALGSQSIVLAGLVAGTVALEKSFDTTDKYIRGQTAQIRLIDYVAMDLRRAHKISVYTRSSGTYQKFAYGSEPFSTVYDDEFLVITEPGFYQSNDPTSSSYSQQNPLISVSSNGSTWGVTYGSSASAVADETVVRYEQYYISDYNSVCFVRREGTQAEIDAGTAPYKVIADNADNLYLNVTAMSDNKSFLIEAWYETDCNNDTGRITSSDRVMLRNPRED